MARSDSRESEVIRAYAQSILQVAQGEGVLDRVERELSQFKELLEKNDSLQEFLKDPKITSEGKQKAVGEILGGDVSGVTRHQIALILSQERAPLLLKIVEEFFRLATESRKKLTARVTTAVPLSEETGKKMEKILSEMAGEPVFLKNSVDPSILGGAVIRIGERIIDGSIKGQLLRLREGIAKKILTEKGKAH